MTPSDLKAIKEACEKATAGPWNIRHTEKAIDCIPYRLVDSHGNSIIYHYYLGSSSQIISLESDKCFIAQSRQWVPDLLAEVERLREALQKISEAREFPYQDKIAREALEESK